MQIDSFMELPKEKRPPKDMWNKQEELDDWFDRVFDRKDNSSGLSFMIDDVEG